jgi:hypothetical protein
MPLQPPVPERFKRLFVEALQCWSCRGWRRKRLAGGKSGAAVFLFQVIPGSARETPPPPCGPGCPGARDNLGPGFYVLKLDQKEIWSRKQTNEQVRHDRARALLGTHVPPLAACHVPGTEPRAKAYQIALLYQVAGEERDIRKLRALDDPDVGGSVLKYCEPVSRTLLRDFNTPPAYDENLTPRKALRDWLGYRLRSEEAFSLHSFVHERTQGMTKFWIGDKEYPNPLWLCTWPHIDVAEYHPCYRGVLHGDLHPGNVLVRHKDRAEEKFFWLIDFALSDPGPLGYDQAYFELGLLLSKLGRAKPKRLVTILEALDPTAGPADTEPEGVERSLLDYLRAFHSAVDAWEVPKKDNHVLPFQAQRMLARVAVSLNWINKGTLKAYKRDLALAYGAWAARKYCADFCDLPVHEIPAYELPPPTAPAGLRPSKTLEGHADVIRELAWSPNGNLLASCGDDGFVRLWRWKSGKLSATLPRRSGPVNCLAWSPDGTLLAIGTKDRTVQFWDATTARFEGPLQGHSDSVVGLAWSPDGRILASASLDRTIRLWDALNRTPLPILAGHRDGVTSLAWSKRRLASASFDKKCFVWDPESGNRVRVLEGHTESVGSLAWSPDGKLLATGSYDRTIRIWDLRSKRPPKVLKGHGKAVSSVAFSHDGAFLASKSHDHTVCLWRCGDWARVESREELASGAWPVGIAFHPSLLVLATLDQNDKAIRIWELDRDVLLRAAPLPEQKPPKK